jgi:hypothetical protein
MDIRQIILDRLKEMDKTPYWLSNQETGMHPNRMRSFLYGTAGFDNIRLHVVEKLLDILGLAVAPTERITPAAKPEKKEKKKS